MISCKSKENYAEKARLSAGVLENIPRYVLTAPLKGIVERQIAEMRVYMDSSAYARKALPLEKELDFTRLRHQADSLFIHMVAWDSLRALVLNGNPAPLNPEDYPLSDKRLLALAMDIQHDSLLQACSRAWKAYFSALEDPLVKGQRRLFRHMVRLHQAWNPRNRHLKEADIEFVVSAESARFVKGLREGYVVALIGRLRDGNLLKSGCTLVREKGLLYYSRVYLAAFDTVLEKKLNGTARAL